MEHFSKLHQDDVAFFGGLLGERCFIDADTLTAYGHDETEDLQYTPAIVLKPISAEEISQIMSYCNERKIPVTPSGARTGLSGGALPIYGGVALSTEKFNRI